MFLTTSIPWNTKLFPHKTDFEEREKEREKREIAIVVGFAWGRVGRRGEDPSQFETYFTIKGTRPMLYFSKKTKKKKKKKKKKGPQH